MVVYEFTLPEDYTLRKSHKGPEKTYLFSFIFRLMNDLLCSDL